jgi:hypothetical protein
MHSSSAIASLDELVRLSGESIALRLEWRIRKQVLQNATYRRQYGPTRDLYFARREALFTHMAELGRRYRDAGVTLEDSPFWPLLAGQRAYSDAYECGRIVRLDELTPECILEGLLRGNAVHWGDWTIRCEEAEASGDAYGHSAFDRVVVVTRKAEGGPGFHRKTFVFCELSTAQAIYAYVRGKPRGEVEVTSADPARVFEQETLDPLPPIARHRITPANLADCFEIAQAIQQRLTLPDELCFWIHPQDAEDVGYVRLGLYTFDAPYPALDDWCVFVEPVASGTAQVRWLARAIGAYEPGGDRHQIRDVEGNADAVVEWCVQRLQAAAAAIHSLVRTGKAA